MANLIETSAWIDGIYQLEQSDPVLGGPPDLANDAGFDNVPHQQLAQRTRWLKAEVEALQAALASFATTAALNTAIEGVHAPGDVFFHAGLTAPPGSLACEGYELGRVAYADLFARIGTTFGAGDGASTFNIPDFRAAFLRGLDNGRGLDIGRVLGAAQAHALQYHTHLLPTSNGTAPMYGVDDTAWEDGANSAPTSGATAITYDRGQSIGGQIGGSFAAETRPFNYALLICIRF